MHASFPPQPISLVSIAGISFLIREDGKAQACAVSSDRQERLSTHTCISHMLLAKLHTRFFLLLFPSLHSLDMLCPSYLFLLLQSQQRFDRVVDGHGASGLFASGDGVVDHLVTLSDDLGLVYISTGTTKEVR